MNKVTKNWTLGSAVLAAAGCAVLAGTLITKPLTASADVKPNNNYYYFVNVGESEFTALDKRLNLGNGKLQGTEEETPDGAKTSDNTWGYTVQGTAGTNAGDEGTVFASYSTGAAYTFTMDAAGEYQLALLVEGTGTVAITPEQAQPDTQTETSERRVLSQAVTLSEAGEITVTTTGYQLYALMVAPKDADVVLHASWAAAAESKDGEGKVIVYGELLEEQTAVEGFTSGGKSYAPVDYSNLPGNAASLNFNSFTASGVIRGTNVTINRYFAVMPAKLKYFINAGSSTGTTKDEWQYGEDENDPQYKFNTLVHQFYRDNDSTLLNDGKADQQSNGTWGYTVGCLRGLRATAAHAFPFNTIRWNTDNGGNALESNKKLGRNIEYELTMDQTGTYTVYLGVRSFWHDRTCKLFFNDQQISGSETVTVTASRMFYAYTVSTDSNKKIKIRLEGPAKEDEACLAFIAVQELGDKPVAAPQNAITSEATTVDVDDSTVTVKGVEAGTIVRMYNSARPYNLLYEEKADANKIGEGGEYVLDFKAPLKGKGVNKFTVVQLTNGGASEGCTFSVTDIKEFGFFSVEGGNEIEFKANYEVGEASPSYTSSDMLLRIKARAASGITKCTVQRDFDPVQTFNLYYAGEMKLDYKVTENGTYKVVVYSGIDGVYLDGELKIDRIDRKAPTLTLSPTANGWDGTAYTVRAALSSSAPVASYTVFKDGSEVRKGTKLPSAFTFEESGEYEISVLTEANTRATASVLVGNLPVYSTVTKKLTGKELTYTFTPTEGYEIQSLYIYRLEDGISTREPGVTGVEEFIAYDPGTYVAVVKTSAGITEMYRFDVSKEDLKSGAKMDFTGAIVAGIIAALAGVGLLVTFLVLKKNKNKKAVAAATAAQAEESAEDETAETEEASKTETESQDVPEKENEEDGE